MLRRFVIVGIIMIMSTLRAEYTMPQAAVEKFPDSGCVLEVEDDAVSFGNSLGKIRWVKEDSCWQGNSTDMSALPFCQNVAIVRNLTQFIP